MSLQEFIAFCEELNDGYYGAAEFWSYEKYTPEIARYVVNEDGTSICFVPQELVTEELIWLSIYNGKKTDGIGLRYAPGNMTITYDMCLAACTAKLQTACPLEFIPKPLIDYNLCMAAVLNPEQPDLPALSFVPKRFLDKGLCTAAVRVNPYALEYVPRKLITYNMCLMACAKKRDHFETSPLIFVPEKFRDERMQQVDKNAGV